MIVAGILAGLVIVFGMAVFVGAPYVPSHARQVYRAFTVLRPLTQDDVVVDLGSGDGVVLRQAAQLGAGRAIGYEINPFLVWISRMSLAGYRKTSDVRIANMWQALPPEGVTVVYVFGVGRDLGRLVALLQRWIAQSGGSIDCVVYGHELPGLTCVRQEGAHRLYSFTPLQHGEAQV